MSHLLSSVVPVLLVHQRANSRADCFIACFIGCASLCFFAWAIAACPLYGLASKSGAFIFCALLQSSSCVVVRFIVMLRYVLGLINYGEQCKGPNQSSSMNQSRINDDQSLSVHLNYYTNKSVIAVKNTKTQAATEKKPADPITSK